MSGWKHALSLQGVEVRELEPPGTVRLIEHEHHDHIHLSPLPSHSPADPLNWPRWRKYTVLVLMSLYCGAVNFGSAGVASALQLLQYQLLPPQPFSKLSHLVAVNVLMIGLSNIIWVPLGHTFGRRPVLIAAMLISVLASVWCGLATSFDSLLAARAIQGFGFGPADSLAASVVGEMFFVHERGRAMAIYTVFLSGGSFMGGLGGGYIAGNHGYRYIFWITTAILGAIFVGECLLVPETHFDRHAQFEAERSDVVATHDEVLADEKVKAAMIERTISGRPRVHGSFTFAESLKVGVWRGHLVQNFLAPWLSLAFPGTWVVMLHYGGLLGGIVTISTVGPQFLAMPPYLWGNNVGLLNVGGLVGTAVGGIMNYLIIDRITTRNAKRQSHGLAEPESRLPAMFPALFLATTGIWTFGFCAANPSEHAWAGMCVGFGMVGFGITQIPSVGFNYIIDAYHPIAADCFVMTTIARSVVSFAWTFFVADWIGRAGAALPFGIFGMLMGVFGLLTVPLWIFGKRMRIATAQRLPKEE